MDFNPNLKSKAIKINYNEANKMPKVSNFFRGDIVTTNNKYPKRSSYDKKEIFYTSRIKENELEPKLLLEKLPPAFNLKNQRNSNDSKKTSNTKYSSNEQRNNSHKKLTLNNSNETSPEDIIKINFSKSKKKEEYKKINNFFIEEEMNIQKQLQIKKNNNKINNKRITSFKLITNNNNAFQKNQGSHIDYYEKNNYPYNNTNNTNNNNSHLKTNFSEYDNIKPKNNLNDLEINSKNKDIRDYLTNSKFKKNSEQKYKLNTININNLNNNCIYNTESLNSSDLPKKKYRKTSDPETHHTELKELKNIYNAKKKNIRSGSYMNMVNCQNILQTDSYYSPISTNTNINTITNLTNNNFSIGGNTLKEIDDFKLSGNSILQNILPQKKNNSKMQKLKSSKYFNENIRSIKNITKINKIPIIAGGVFGNININLKLNSNGHRRHHENIDSDHENIKNTKKEIENINEGITFRYNNGYKYYFNLRSANIYFLKEVQNNLVKGFSTAINAWNKLFHKNSNYLKIICRKINIPENHYTFIIEYPKGGESIYDIINSIGLYEQQYIHKIISEIYKNILILKNENDNDIIKHYQNIPFCLCNIFLTINGEIKIMNPIIRKMHINSNKNIENNNKSKKENNNICQCMKNFEKLKIIFNIHNNSLFCLGFAILQLITQNLLFKLKSYNLLLNQKNAQIINNNKYCCLLHSLLNIENSQKYNIDNNDLKLSNFLYLYDSNLLNFIHQCTKFNTDISDYPNSDFIDNYEDMDNDINISIKELFKIITHIKLNDYISQNNFFSTFELLYKDIKINSINFKNLLHENKVINILIRSFVIDKSDFKSKFKKIINTETNSEYDEYDENKNFVNSGNYFYSSSLKKKLENTGNNNWNELNLESDNKKDNNQGIIIFKNYNSNENI